MTVLQKCEEAPVLARYNGTNQDVHDYGYKPKPIYDIFETGEWTGAIGCVKSVC